MGTKLTQLQEMTLYKKSLNNMMLFESKYQNYFKKTMKDKYGTEDMGELNDDDKIDLLKYVDLTFNSKQEPGKTGVSETNIKKLKKEEDAFNKPIITEQVLYDVPLTESEQELKVTIDENMELINYKLDKHFRYSNEFKRILDESKVDDIKQLNYDEQYRITNKLINRFDVIKETYCLKC